MSRRKRQNPPQAVAHATQNRHWWWLILGIVTVFVVLAIAIPLFRRTPKIQASAAESTTFDPVGKFAPTAPNTQSAPGQVPAGMVWITGGEFSMGAQDPPDMDDVGMKATRDSRPIHRVYVDSFWLDKTDVTNKEFAKFVRATGYVTVAERTPKAEDFPGAP